MNLKTEKRLSGDSRTVNKSSSYFTVNRIALLSVMTALVTVGRLTFSLPIFPNIQPMTALLILIALNLGVIDSLVVSVLSLLLTNLFLGMGPWTILQMISFAVVILLTGIIKYFYRYESFINRIVFSFWAGLMGFGYGLIISYLNFQLYGMNNFLVYYINGLPFDILHAVGNVGFFLILEPIIVPIMKNKFEELFI